MTSRLTPQAMRGVLYLWLLVGHPDLRAARAAFAGPYFMVVKALSNCPREEVEVEESICDVCITSALRHNHTMKAAVMDANITISNGVFTRGQSTMNLDVARWNSVSGWREHFLIMPLGELCFVYEDIVTDIMKVFSSLTGVPTKCPIPDGTYGGGNTPAKIMPLRHFPSLPYGRFRVYTFFNFAKKPDKGKVSVVRGCLRLVVDVVPQ